jgi:hypothetical protein
MPFRNPFRSLRRFWLRRRPNFLRGRGNLDRILRYGRQMDMSQEELDQFVADIYADRREAGKASLRH